MRPIMIMLAAASLMTGAASITSASAQTAAASPAAGHYSASTTLIGKLLDDPAAVAVLKKLIPSVYANPMFQSGGREMTLKDIQQYEPDALSDANLAKIQAEFDKLPPKS